MTQPITNNEFKNLDKVLYGNLIPWSDNNKPDEKFTSMISEISKVEPEFPVCFEIEFQRTFNQKTKYYQKLIRNQSIAYCNRIHQIINENDNIKAHKYWRNDTLNKKIPSRLKDIGKIIKDWQYLLEYINPRKTSLNIDSDHKTETYIVHFLKLSLMYIYLEVQEMYKFIQDDDLLIEDDFYTQFLYEPVPDSRFIKRVKTISIPTNLKKQNKLTFGFNQPDTSKLKNICRLLNLKIDFLNDDKTSEEDFIEIMTSKNLSDTHVQIHIGCETTQFRYIIDKFIPYFNSLSLINIEKSKLFYSKNGFLITATNLSRNKLKFPKEKETIDNIFKEMQ